MVYYGEWVQLGDYVQNGQAIPYAAEPHLNFASRASFDDPGYSWNPASSDFAPHLNELLARAQSTTVERLANTAGNSAIFSASLKSVETGASGANSLATIRVGPVTLTPPASIYPSMPEGAVAYEWAEPTGTPVSASLELVNLEPGGTLDTADNYGDWQVRLGVAESTHDAPLHYPVDATTVHFWSQDQRASVNKFIDVTDVIDATGTYQINADAPSATVERYATPSVATPFARWAAGIQLLVNGNVFPKYVVRPPLFRWVYDEPPTRPYLRRCRRFPRE